MIRRGGGKEFLAGIGVAAALLGPVPGMTGAARAATIVAQTPCVKGSNEFCVSYGTTGAIPTIRSVTFTAPRAGKAIVTFHGSLTCINFTSTKGRLQMVSQIVSAAGATPAPDQPGGLIHIGTLPPQGEAAYNLGSTRVFTINAAGQFTYFFKVRRIALTPSGTQCRVYNAAFTIQFER
jgi:hypothetical protein